MFISFELMCLSMIIGIAGMLGAGKGTVVNYLLTRGFKHYSVRAYLMEEIVRRGLAVNRDNMVLVANDLRARSGPGYIVEELYKKAMKIGGDCVIESIRCVGEIEALRRKGGFVLFGVDADVEIRYARIVERGSLTDRVSFDKFVRQEQFEMSSDDPTKQNLRACIEMADYRFKNDWTIADLQKRVAAVLGKIGFGEERLSTQMGEMGFEIKKGGGGRVLKREGYLSWDDYFMSIAMLSAERSKDPNTRVGACIVDPNKKIIGVGYNGFPIGCSDDILPWNREGDYMDVKYPYVCHSELNAILNSVGRNLGGSSIYVALCPCNECAKAIIQSGIREVVYLSDKYSHVDTTKAAKKMFSLAGVKLRKIVPTKKSVLINLDVEE